MSHALVHPTVHEAVTGKLVLGAQEDDDGDRRLKVDVELARDVEPDPALGDRVADAVQTAILQQSGEYGSYVPTERQRPQITLWRYADPACFPAGIKHRWVR